ncbi:MAG TPA: dihydrodipicolinate reductase C-terminal domain-containing protein [Vicinamibacterales bacterium]|nr:dihydrodipicolinate reductase C-terminal domain-containing protein [Vicinamibacterales bacterium]
MSPIPILLVGYGKMGKMVESLASEYGCEVGGIVDPLVGSETVDSSRWNGIDVAVDFSSPDAVVKNVAALARRRVNVVVGTTGWGAREAELREMVDGAEVGIVAAPNFSTGVVIFEAMVAHAATLLARQNEFAAFLHEAHHQAKKDAPSGTALLLRDGMVRAGFPRPIDVSSTRAGYIPGTHTVGFDGPAETITLTHTARDRTAFARGALAAAKWVRGRRGWFTMRDVLGL